MVQTVDAYVMNNTAPAVNATATSTANLPGDTAFQVKDGAATYIFRWIDAATAESLGCPGANAVLIGRNGSLVGTAAVVTGRTVKVPGWYSRRGQLTTFTTPDTTLKGWIGE